MRLTSIRLAGFKSFVDPTTLALGSNLTGVVGPNGCGKSNVIDAVRWVTGESSARQLRGEALQDVIFNGSRARKPVGRASVELRFDNSDGELGGRYGAFAEISIKRELARDGGSRYFINAARARRRDVIDLFLGTGLGGRSNYAVIEQGAVNRLIEARPEDMRQVLEEAAGISKYKERRRETENRIRHTRENLDRLDDLIGEVTQRLKVLKRQAANAEKYKQLKVDERRLRAELLALRWSAQTEGVQAARERLSECENALRAATSSQRESQQAHDEHSVSQQQAMARVQSQQTEFYDAQAAASRIEQRLAHAREVCEMRQRERDELVRRRENLEARDTNDQQADQAAQQDIERCENEREQAAQQMQEARVALSAAEQAASAAESAWEAHNSAEHNPVQQLDAERTRARYALERQKELAQRRNSRQTERAGLGEDETKAIEVAERDLADRVERLEREQGAVADIAGTDDALRRAIVDADRAVTELRTGLGEVQARLSSEKTLQQSVLREDDANLGEWLSRHGHGHAAGVARRVQVKPEWQTAAEAVLGGWLRGFVVDTLAWRDDQWPPEPLTLVEASDRDAAGSAPATGPDGLPALAAGLQAPAAIRALAERVYVVDEVSRALELRSSLAPDQRLVTLDGCCIGPRSLVTPAGEAAEKGLLERGERISHLEVEVERQQAAFADKQAELESERERHGAIQQRRQQLDRSIAAGQRELETARAQQQGRRMRTEQLRQRRGEIDMELTELAGQIETADREAQDAAASVDRLVEQAEAFVAARRRAQADLAAARKQRDAARQDFDVAARTVDAGDRRLEQWATHRESISARRHDTRAERADVDARLAAFDAQADTADSGVPNEEEHTRAVAAQTRAERELRGAREALKTHDRALQDSKQQFMQTEQRVEAAREALQQARIDAETADVRRAGVAEQLDELGETPEALIERLPDDADADRWSAQIETVERRIQRLGAINLAAIEEYDAEAERESYLRGQHADLAQALETLEAAIARIDRETRARFKATYEEVNDRFARMFPELFGGGEAALELTEDDWLVTGVRAMARPPGKRNASIQMLSGGEKALTAVALLFALFELNPAPFCMLDEIDAPLDDANVSRFCDLVRRMSARIQFIVITHNKLTMSLAEQLHGVTMVEPGVSRLVSVDIDDALDMAG